MSEISTRPISMSLKGKIVVLVDDEIVAQIADGDYVLVTSEAYTALTDDVIDYWSAGGKNGQ